MKYCVACKYHEFDDVGRWLKEKHLCTRFKTSLDIVTKSPNERIVLCHDERQSCTGCGLQAIFFEEKG